MSVCEDMLEDVCGECDLKGMSVVMRGCVDRNNRWLRFGKTHLSCS